MMAERSEIKVHRVCSCREEDIDYVVDERGWCELPDVICIKCGQLTIVEILQLDQENAKENEKREGKN